MSVVNLNYSPSTVAFLFFRLACPPSTTSESESNSMSWCLLIENVDGNTLGVSGNVPVLVGADFCSNGAWIEHTAEVLGLLEVRALESVVVAAAMSWQWEERTAGLMLLMSLSLAVGRLFHWGWAAILSVIFDYLWEIQWLSVVECALYIDTETLTLLYSSKPPSPEPEPPLTAWKSQSPSRKPFRLLLTASGGLGYPSLAWLGLQPEAEPSTSLDIMGQ